MSVDFSTLSLTDLLAKRTEIDTQLALKTGGAVVNATGKKGKKDKKQSKRAGKPTVYGAFSSKIQKEHADEIKAYKEANPEMKGAHMSFVGTYKKEHDEEYKAFEAEWREAHPKDAVESSPEDAEVGDSASSSGQPVAAEKPKRVLSPEHLAKLKAGREAAKAKKDAEKATSEAAGKSESDVAPVAAVPKKQPKKAKKADAPVAAPSPAPIPEPVAAPAPEENDDAPEFLPFKFGGLQYLRLGTKREDGNHLWATGDLWSSKKGAKGPYVGCMTEGGEIDTDAEEPTLE
jgi:hypothetical protein